MIGLYVGIDPGQKGGVVALDPSGITVLCITGEELHPAKILNLARLEHFLAELCRAANGGEVVLALEGQGPRGATGRAVCFKIGHEYGMWMGVLHALSFRFCTPSPAVWMKTVVGVGGKGKQRQIRYCDIHFPDLDLFPGRKRTPHDGLADAACLADWLRLHGPYRKAAA